MKRVFVAGGALAAAAAFAPAGGRGEEPEPSVTYARTWDAAVEEAKFLNVPIVVHSHGFYCPPCNGVHSAVLKNKKYIAFAEESTVEVISLQDLDKGIEKNDKRAGTYKEKGADGQDRECLIEWAGLTVEDIDTLRGSKASSYNNTGRIPYTAIIDPYTLEEMSNIPGGYGAGTLMDAVTVAKKQLEKEHGKSVSRKALTKVKDADREIREDLAKGNLAKALADSAALEKKVAKESAAVVDLAAKNRTDVLDAGTKQLDDIDAMIARGEKAEAAKQIGPLSRALKGTTLEARALELAEKSK
ncbi:MAG: hypothetical protein ACHQ1G_08125 [Planctomycetota bacterium]